MTVEIADPRYKEARWVSSASKIFAAVMPKTVLEPERTAFFIVDMQNENCLPDAGIMTALKDNTQILEAVNTELHNLADEGTLLKSGRGGVVVYMLP